jgi:hypothetical protein
MFAAIIRLPDIPTQFMKDPYTAVLFFILFLKQEGLPAASAANAALSES